MKNLILAFTCFIIASLCCAQTNIYEDFDSYKAGEYLGTESNGIWTTWTNATGSPEDTYVTDLLSYSGENSINLQSGGVVDVVLPLGNENSGSWTLKFKMFVEESYGAYFNLLHYFSAAASNWASQFYFNSGGNGFLTVGGGLNDLGTNFTYPVDTWFEVKINIDVDGDYAELYFDDVSVYNWLWSEGSTGPSNTIAALNLYPNGMDNEPDSYFVDNVSFHEYGLGLAELQRALNVYPNPARNTFSINTEQNSCIEIYNVLGKRIENFTTKNCQFVVDCSNWERGLYFIKSINESGKDKISKLIVN
ncbi:MAG: hypothetical protein CM15mP23_07660 [Cryomorphaceae bacterium]|nr:MAG: hypothetical protein CM15mP23_07660 [Cryomorphaceae bacterium]